MQIYTTNQLQEIAYELRDFKAIIVKTDTVYGLISLEQDLIYKIKKRSLSKKIILFINNIDQIDLPENYKNIISKYWPGKLTVIWKSKSYRIPNSKFLLNLVDEVGPLYSSSANISGMDPITSLDEAKMIFAKFNYSLALVDDQETYLSSKPSTIIDLDKNKVIRNGEIDGQKILDEIMKG